MVKAVEQGIVQAMIGESAREFAHKVETGEQVIVGVNAYQTEEDGSGRQPLERPDAERIQVQLDQLRSFKADRDHTKVRTALDQLAAAANSDDINVFGEIVDAAIAGVTHGEIVACLRREMGIGEPLITI